jgi:hypothetical protein
MRFEGQMAGRWDGLTDRRGEVLNLGKRQQGDGEDTEHRVASLWM